jgi:outer membrane protein OmpA-like peptidoglycan-associated protein
MRISVLLVGLISITSISNAQGWRGIVPLHSNRADVEKLIGPPMQPNGITYDLKNERVNIVYSNAGCEREKVEWNVPRGTVIGITIYPQTRLVVSDLRVALDKFEKFINPNNPEFIAYNNKEEGMGLGVNPKGEVEVIEYFPTTKDSHLRCANFSREQLTVDELDYFKFDEFSNQSRADERARLDNFAARFRDKPGARAYVVVYPNKLEKVSASRARADRMKDYLIRAGGIEPARVNVIIAGREGIAKTGLFVVPSNITVLPR